MIWATRSTPTLSVILFLTMCSASRQSIPQSIVHFGKLINQWCQESSIWSVPRWFLQFVKNSKVRNERCVIIVSTVHYIICTNTYVAASFTRVPTVASSISAGGRCGSTSITNQGYDCLYVSFCASINWKCKMEERQHNGRFQCSCHGERRSHSLYCSREQLGEVAIHF